MEIESQDRKPASTFELKAGSELQNVNLPSFGSQIIASPLHLPEHLGRPIPDSPYAVSVAMPTWRDVVDYETGSPRVGNALQSGYPRFAIKGLTAEFFIELRSRYCAPGEDLVAFPTFASAKRCLDFIQKDFPGSGRLVESDFPSITICVVPDHAYKCARSYWQHTGEIISARQAEACLHGIVQTNSISAAKATLSERLAQLAFTDASHVSLFPSGMAGIAAIQRVVQLASPGLKTAQVGFPYVDSLKVQEKFGSGYFFFPVSGTQQIIEQELQELSTLAATGKIAAIYCEFPANPLLTVPPLERLWEISTRHKIPLIVDETLGTLANVRVLPYATAIVTSLTKYVSGAGDVCAGSVIWNPDHPAYEQLHAHWDKHFEDQLFEGDAEALEKNSRDFSQRMHLINAGASQLVDYLSQHSKVGSVYYPNQDPSQLRTYDQFRIPNGGYGGLFSLRVNGGPDAAAKVYDALAINKGPSLGTNFTIACPYTLLAHFHELEQVSRLGVPPDLIRVSVGLEDPSNLISRFENALSVLV